VSFTQSRTSSQTTTLARVKYVTRKVQSDLLAALDLYGYYTEEYGLKIIRDLRVFLDDEVIDRVDFVWTRRGTNDVLDSLAYTVVRGDALPNHGSGDIRYHPNLVSSLSSFSVVIYRNQRWRNMTDASKQDVRSRLELDWESDANHNYGLGRWETDRTYSKDGYGLERKRFVRAS
jgi:hypothetical protein